MKVTVFGLGYVGTVCCASLAKHGHLVTGIDTQPGKVEMITRGEAPVVEPGLSQAIKSAVESGNLTATENVEVAMRGAEVMLVCVGTPSNADGSPDLKYIMRVMSDIAANLPAAAAYPVIAIRSTVPPLTVALCAKVLAKRSGKKTGQDFTVVSNPEFLREGTALADFDNPPFTLIGSEHKRGEETMQQLYSHVPAPFFSVGVEEAEIIKYVCNALHASKITFANEIGSLCKAMNIDSRLVMNIVCRDTILNISPAYLNPGFAYGGSCLPKDLQALVHAACTHGVNVPLLNSIAHSNEAHIQRVVQLIESTGSRKVGFLGISFKAGTDDVRNSPSIRVVEILLSRGYNIRIFDPNINVSHLLGSNLHYIESRVNHLSNYLDQSADELLSKCDVLVVTNNDPAFQSALTHVAEHHTIIDLCRVSDGTITRGNYHGICW